MRLSNRENDSVHLEEVIFFGHDSCTEWLSARRIDTLRDELLLYADMMSCKRHPSFCV